MAYGICKLTGEHGKFVDAHIIPKAFTKHSNTGEAFVEHGFGKGRPRKNFSSWYDNQLVIRKGEDVLATLDNWAISSLRYSKLVWSGDWREGELPDHEIRDEEAGTGIRHVRGIDGSKLKLFVHSLLWRAAASQRPELSDIALPDDDLERLRQSLLSNRPEHHHFYPYFLVQLSTRGENHNQTPIASSLPLPDFKGGISGHMRTYRFYFDGLIIHVKRREYDDSFCFESPFVNDANGAMASTVTYEKSAQKTQLTQAMLDAHRWPSTLARVLGSLGGKQKSGPDTDIHIV